MNVYGGDCMVQFVCHSPQKKKPLAHHSLIWLSGRGIPSQNSQFLLWAGSLCLIRIIRFWETAHLPLLLANILP